MDTAPVRQNSPNSKLIWTGDGRAARFAIVYGFCILSVTTAASWSLSNVLMTGTKATLEFTESVAIGFQRAMDECRVQFTWDRWNCPSNAFTKPKTLPATKETAFVHAITAAGVMHTLTRNCSSGDFDTCGCDESKLSNSGGKKWKWGGCSENTRFGAEVSKDYLDARELGKDARALVIVHNYNAGRIVLPLMRWPCTLCVSNNSTIVATVRKDGGPKAVVKSMILLCKCHGVSGSCSTKTCWKQLSDFSTVGRHLKNQHDRSMNVEYQNGILNVGEEKSPTLPQLSENNLVYLEHSPNYCFSNLTVGSHGTLGRECSREKGRQVENAERKSCKTLCRQCGLRVKKTLAKVTVSCNCKFQWCCEVKCQTCKKKVNKLTCVI